MALKDKLTEDSSLLFSSRNKINTRRRFESRSGRQLKWIEHGDVFTRGCNLHECMRNICRLVHIESRTISSAAWK